jgi:hypothetical protein
MKIKYFRKNIGGGGDASHDSKFGPVDAIRKSCEPDPVDRVVRRQGNNLCRSRGGNTHAQTGSSGQQVN